MKQNTIEDKTYESIDFLEDIVEMERYNELKTIKEKEEFVEYEINSNAEQNFKEDEGLLRIDWKKYPNLDYIYGWKGMNNENGLHGFDWLRKHFDIDFSYTFWDYNDGIFLNNELNNRIQWDLSEDKDGATTIYKWMKNDTEPTELRILDGAEYILEEEYINLCEDVEEQIKEQVQFYETLKFHIDDFIEENK